MSQFLVFFDSFSPKTLKCPFFHFWTIWSLLVPPPLWEPSGRRLGEVWETAGETAGRRLGGVWKASGRRAGAAWERFAGRLGDVWAHTGGRSWRRRRAPGEESRGGGGAGWGSRRCGSGQPAVPAGGISPTESSWCQRAPGPEVVPLHSYPRRGLTGTYMLGAHVGLSMCSYPKLLCLHLGRPEMVQFEVE